MGHYVKTFGPATVGEVERQANNFLNQCRDKLINFKCRYAGEDSYITLSLQTLFKSKPKQYEFLNCSSDAKRINEAVMNFIHDNHGVKKVEDVVIIPTAYDPESVFLKVIFTPVGSYSF